MKRTLAIILTAVFLSALSIPCGATGTETTASRVYSGFADVAEGGASYEAVKLCYERGLMNGTSDTAFNPQGKLTVAQLVMLAANVWMNPMAFNSTAEESGRKFMVFRQMLESFGLDIVDDEVRARIVELAAIYQTKQ